MLSQTLSQVLERARARFGLEVEILDMGLRSVYPGSSSEFGQVVAGSPGLRQNLLDAMIAGRPHDVNQSGQSYRVYPLRQSLKRRQAAGLLAIKRTPPRGVPDDVEPWSELAQAIVEADLASVDTLREERHRSRQYAGLLKFLELLNEAADERALALSLVQAIAVWHDADARVYRRSLSGDFVLHTCLPGVRPEERASRVTARVFDTDHDMKRLGAASEFGTAGADTVIIPVAASTNREWALAVIGTIPADAEPSLRVIARVAAARLHALAAARAEETRQHFENLTTHGAPALELTAGRILHELVNRAGAASGALTLARGSEARRLAAVGPQDGRADSGADVDTAHAHLIVRVMPLGGEFRARLELRAGADAELTPDGAEIVRVAAEVVRPWLAGTLVSMQDASGVLERLWVVADFSRRLHEELERAKRFHLDLALILIDVAAPEAASVALQEALQNELRGSDVLGSTGTRQVGALLTHTNGIGLDTVVMRLKERLADAAVRLNVSELRVGRAALSPECRTAEALLTAAMLSSEPVTVH